MVDAFSVWKQWFEGEPVSYTHLDVYKRQEYYSRSSQTTIATTFVLSCLCLVPLSRSIVLTIVLFRNAVVVLRFIDGYESKQNFRWIARTECQRIG